MSVTDTPHTTEDYDRIASEMGLALASDETSHDNITEVLSIMQENGFALFQDEVVDLLRFMEVVGYNLAPDNPREPLLKFAAIKDAFKELSGGFAGRDR